MALNTNWKRRRVKFKPVNSSTSVNKHLSEIILGYFRNSTRSELTIDLLIPFCLSAVIFGIVGYYSVYLFNIVEVFNDIVSNSMAVMAILAGFNTTCLAVIASTNKKTLTNLFGATFEGNSNKDVSILKIILIFYCYAICVQIAILVLGILYITLNKSFVNLYNLVSFLNRDILRIIISLFGAIVTTVIIHILFVSLRNVTLLYRYILYIANYKIEEAPTDDSL